MTGISNDERKLRALYKLLIKKRDSMERTHHDWYQQFSKIHPIGEKGLWRTMEICKVQCELDPRHEREWRARGRRT